MQSAAVVTDIHANLLALQAPLERFPLLTDDEGRLDVTIERAEYDARSVAEELAAAGLPTEYADKLLTAA